MEKKQNNTLTKFIDYKRFTLIIPAILLALALLVFAIWGVNTGYDYRESNTYDIHFNVTVSSKDFKTYSNIVKETFKKECGNEFVVKVTKVNDDITSACKVNVYNNSDLSDDAFMEKIESVNEIIETKLNQLNNDRQVRITDVKVQQPQTYGDHLLMGCIAAVILMAGAFVYFVFRFELKTALVSLIIAPYSLINMLSIMVLFRIPFTSVFMLPALLSIAVGYIMFTLIFDNIRHNLENQENTLTNESLVYGSIGVNSINLIGIVSAISLVLVLLTFVFNISTLYMCISLLLAVVVAVYSAIVLPCTLWAMIYNKQKDNRLKARIRILEARQEKKNAKQAKKKDENGAIV